MIERSVFKEILKMIDHFPVTLVSGPRQVGKSTLLYNKLKPLGYNYVSLDDRFERLLAQNDPSNFLRTHPSPLIIDEVQYAPELFDAMESVVNKVRLEQGYEKANGMFVITGSQSFQLMSKARQSMAGRIGILTMMPLSMNEIQKREEIPFIPDFDVVMERSRNVSLNEEQLLHSIVRGFFPILYDDKEMPIERFYSSYISTYLERDLPEILEIRDEKKFLTFLQIIASTTGQELVFEHLAIQVGIVTNTLKSWVHALEASGIIYLLQPYSENSFVKRVVKRPKLYFSDTGLACHLVGISSGKTLAKSFLKGRIVETYIVNEILKSHLNNGLGKQSLFYYRDNQQNEVDLVLLYEGTLHLIEAKSGMEYHDSDTKGFLALSDTQLNKGQNCILCTTEKVYKLKNGTIVIPVSAI